MLTLKNVTITFGGLKAVNNLSLDIPKGTIYSIIGPNGAGKTTLFNCISRFYTPTSGEIKFDGKDILQYKPHDLAKLGISRSFQNTELFAKMTVMDNLLTGYHSQMPRNLLSIALRLPSTRNIEREVRKKASEVLELLNIPHLENEQVYNLPFGYQKMVDIGRSMMINPKLIMLDEPVAGMNTNESAEISRLIKRLKAEMGYTVLLIEHDMSVVMSISDYVAVMNFGNKISEGLPGKVQNDQVVIDAYLGGGDQVAKVN